MIKTWRQRCEEHPDHDGIVSEAMIQARMQEEIDELRAAIQQAQEPVAWLVQYPNKHEFLWGEKPQWIADAVGIEPLYTAPREWQGLTDEEIEAMMDYWSDDARSAYGGAHVANGEYVYIPDIIRDAEAKLKEKNHG